MSERSRKLTKVGMGPASPAESGKVPKFRDLDDNAPLAYRPTMPAPRVSTPPSGRKTAAYDSFVDASEINPVISEPPPQEKSQPAARAPRTSVRRTEPPPGPEDSPPPRSARVSVRRSEPPDPMDRTTRSGREAISIDEVGPTSGGKAISLPPGARPKVAPRKKNTSPPPLNGRDAHVLVYVNGQRTVKEIVDASKLRPAETAASLQKLLRIGVILF